jgi:hypothetical protein
VPALEHTVVKGQAVQADMCDVFWKRPAGQFLQLWPPHMLIVPAAHSEQLAACSFSATRPGAQSAQALWPSLLALVPLRQFEQYCSPSVAVQRPGSQWMQAVCPEMFKALPTGQDAQSDELELLANLPGRHFLHSRAAEYLPGSHIAHRATEFAPPEFTKTAPGWQLLSVHTQAFVFANVLLTPFACEELAQNQVACFNSGHFLQMPFSSPTGQVLSGPGYWKHFRSTHFGAGYTQSVPSKGAT